MALKTYVGPHDSVDLRVAGHDIGTVERGSAIFIPDHLVNLVHWPEAFWQDGAPELAKAKTGKDVK